MEPLKGLNDGLLYIEAHLAEPLDTRALARAAGMSQAGFRRLFSGLAGLGVDEYMRRRRLSEAGLELVKHRIPVSRAAVSWGYNSLDAFSRAFRRQHGAAPSGVAASGGPLVLYPPLRFQINATGSEGMQVRFVEMPEKTVFGLGETLPATAAERWEEVHYMWADHHKDIQNKVDSQVPGIWYGIWDGGHYAIARERQAPGLDGFTLKAGRYAVFESERGTRAYDELPRLRRRVFEEGLPALGCARAEDYEIEVYHLYGREEKRRQYYELWVPVAGG